MHTTGCAEERNRIVRVTQLLLRKPIMQLPKIAKNHYEILIIMKRLIVLGLLFGVFAFACKKYTVIDIKVVGQPSMTGSMQKNMEQPFFESLQKKTGLPIIVDYRPVDQMGFKDNFELAMLKRDPIDIVSLRFVQNGQDEPSLIGIDLPGLIPDYQTAREIGQAYGTFIDENLQHRYDAKLLGLWTFGPQIIFCNKPVHQLSDLKGLKVRVGGAFMTPLIQSLGGFPIVIPFEQVADSLAQKAIDCAISSETSAYGAKWPAHLTHIYPIVTQMGTNGIVIRLKTWNKFSESQKIRLTDAVNSYVENTWNFAKKINRQASDCMQGTDNCVLDTRYKLVVSPIKRDDKEILRHFAIHQSFPVWAESCNKVHPNCSIRWKAAVEPIMNRTH